MKESTQIDRGLSYQDVEERKKSGLINGEFDIKTKSIKKIIYDNVFTLFNLINLILVICVIFVHSYKNMLFFAVVIWNILIGIVQEIKAKSVIERLSILSVPKANVLRNGEVHIIEIKDVVIDDLLLLVSGNQICCDSTIVDGECEVNESLITGESKPIFKETGDELLSGSYIVAGNIKAVVKNLGKDNYVNKITQGAKYIKKPNSEIMRSLKKLIKTITIFLIPIALILCYKQLFVTDQSYGRAVVSIVAAVSGMIPSGFILLTSIVLAVSVIRLAKHNTLAQDLYCVETLARVDVLCLDKTGTITEGNMQVDEVISLNKDNSFDLEFALNAYTCALNDNNPTFNAIKSIYHKQIQYEPSVIIPFSSHNKWSLASYINLGSYILGAPEFILENIVPEIKEVIDKNTEDGRRVLLFAYSGNLPINRELPLEVVPLALIILSDKIRYNVRETLEFFDKQGVTIKIISGDKPETVSHIAKRAGVKGYEQYIDASTLKDRDDINRAALSYTVFGRVSPNQKLELIKALQENKHIVAMTGDGVNDVLALKEADCSIAMQNGSDAARNTSQLILMDSDFSSMPLIVAEGRRSINNLQRSGALYLIKTIYASLLAVLFVFVSNPYPFVPVQMTLIGAVTIGIPSFFLALEKNNKRVKEYFIRNVLKLAVPGGLLVVSNIIGALFITSRLDATVEQIGTVTSYSTIITSLIVLFYICIPLNLRRGLLLSCIVAVFITAVTFFGKFFYFVNLPKNMLIVIVALGVVSFLLYHVYKYIVDRILN